MKRLDLQKCIVGSVFTNCYFLKNKETEEMLIVDPGDNADRIEQKVLEMQGRPVAILLTHGHFDHILAAEEIKKKYNIPIYACAKEEKTLQDPRINLTAFHMSSYTLKADVYLTDLQVVELAGFSVQMIETPGHTLGSCCYYLKDEGVLFSGDTVFCGSVGRTDFPEGSTALFSGVFLCFEYLSGHPVYCTIPYGCCRCCLGYDSFSVSFCPVQSARRPEKLPGTAFTPRRFS